MPEIWDPTLPRCFVMGATEQPGDPRLRSQTDTGPAKVRRRSSAVAGQRAGIMKMTPAQWDALLVFGETTLQGWADPFLFPDADGDLVRFGETLPSRTSVAAGALNVAIELEVLP